jgi:hypothetical protein
MFKVVIFLCDSTVSTAVSFVLQHKKFLIQAESCCAVPVIHKLSVIILCFYEILQYMYFNSARVTLEDLYNGKTTTVEVEREVLCAKCHGLELFAMDFKLCLLAWC